jgi:uncharacterized membrane protein
MIQFINRNNSGANMNPLKSIPGTIICGFVVAVLFAWFHGDPALNKASLVVWLHVIAGVVWIGLLYYFNFVQVPAVAEGNADADGPGPAGINKYAAPRALLWFRWGAVATWLTGAAALEIIGIGIADAFSLAAGAEVIGIGAWLGTIMLFNVWVLIWPNQKKVLGIVEANDEEKASARVTALMASRTNTVLSIPMLMCMVAYGHAGLPF